MMVRHRRKGILLAVAVLVSASWPARLEAWGSEGHKIVCEIAWQRLTPESKKWVRELRASDPAPGESFSASCLWADDVRHDTHRSTYPYHFVNIARGASGLDLARDCPAYDCVPVAIRRYSVYLTREHVEDRDRAEALKFVGHFVGDVHQPLHAGYAADRGGNEIAVEWFGKTRSGDDALDLHEVWDIEILRRAKLSHPRSALELDAEITDEEAAAWSDFDVDGWVDESFRWAVEVAYDLPRDRKLGKESFRRAQPVVVQQLKKAGVRLAHLVNSIVDGTFESFGP